MTHVKKVNGLFIFILSFLAFSFPSFAQAVSETEIIFDASGSMNDKRVNLVKLDMAKEALATIAGQIPQGSSVGLRIFGSTPVTGNANESCKDSKLVFPISGFQKDAMIQNVTGLRSYGMTALGHSLELAGEDFSKTADVKKNIILISDGEETCGKDPIAVMEALKARGIQIVIHAISFSASDAGKAQLKKLSDVTGGTYREAEDTASLKDSLAASVEQTLLLKLKNDSSGENILAATSGARIVSSDNKLFANLIDGSEERVGPFGYSNQAVFSFKDNQPVLLEKFLVPIFKTEGSNIGEVKLYGSTNQPDSGFFKISDFNPENKVAFGNVYQEFKINPPSPVRYLRVLLGMGAGGGRNSVIYGEELKAEGKYLSADEFKSELAKRPAPEMNVLAKENGGEMIAGARAEYADLITAKSDIFGGYVDINIGSEAIFGFKDGKTAMLTKIGIPILETSPNNIKGIEISISEAAPTGPFEVAGTFETTNMVFPKNLIQEYTFKKPVKVKYLKIKFVSHHGGNSCYAYQILAMGTLD